MKNLKIFFLSALVALAGLFTACTEDSDWSAGQPAEGPQVYFASTVATTYAIDAETSSVTIPVSRIATEGSMDAPILATISEEYSSLFTVPATVLFNEGAASTNLTITFDRESMEAGKSYDVTLAVDDPTLTTPYGYSTLTITLRVPEAFNLLGTGLWREDILTTFFGVGNPEWEVEIYEDVAVKGLLYVKNVYGANCPLFSNPSDPDEPHYIIIDASDPTAVSIARQSIGVDVGYGLCSFGSIAAGTLVDKVITFPAQGLIFSMADYEGGGWYYSNGGGLWRLALPGAVLTDFSVEIEAAGHVADQGGNACPIVNVYGGVDVAAVAIEFVEGDITTDYASVVAAMAEASTDDLSYATLKMNKETEVMEGQVTSKKAVASGTVTAVVLPYNADGEAQVDDAVAVTFYFAGCGAEAPACELEAYLFPYTQFWDADEQYSDANSVAFGLMGTEIKYCSFSLWDTESFDMYTAAGYGLDAFVDPDPEGEDAVPAEYIDGYINDGGLVMSFRGLPSEMEFILVAWAQNIYDSEIYVTSNRLSTTAAAAAAASAKAKFNGQGMLKSMQRVDLKLTWTKHEIK